MEKDTCIFYCKKKKEKKEECQKVNIFYVDNVLLLYGYLHIIRYTVEIIPVSF